MRFAGTRVQPRHDRSSGCSLAASGLSMLVALGLAWCVGVASAQEPIGGCSADIGAPRGARRFVPGRSSLVGITAINRTEQPASLLAAALFPEDPTMQYGRQLWVPPRAVRRSWCTVFTPEALRSKSVVELQSLAFDRTGGAERRLRPGSGEMLSSRLASIDHEASITAVIPAEDHDPMEMELVSAVEAIRNAARLSRRLTFLRGDFLPPTAEGLDPFDQIVLWSDTPATDSAGRAAIRTWLRRGGRLWIMLDRVQPETVSLLLGDAFLGSIVDRVGLTEVTIVRTMDDQRHGPTSHDRPVDMVRVLLEGAEITHTVDGWPASFWLKIGQGEVLFTTLDMRAWYRAREPADRVYVSELDKSDFVPREPLDDLGWRLLQPRAAGAELPEIAAAVLAERIGYRVLARETVAGILGGFCLTLVVAGGWLARRKRLEQLIWIAPLAAVAATGVFVWLGSAARRSVPPTVAFVERAEAERRSDEVVIHGLAALYTQQPRSAELGGREMALTPDMSGLEGSVRRIVWTDATSWRWEGLELPAGVRLASFRGAVNVTPRIAARGRFGPAGFSGTLSGPLRGVSDAIVAMPGREKMALRLDSRGRFTVGPDDGLTASQFVASGLLTDRQQQRQMLYRQMVDDVRGPNGGPVVYAWAEAIDAGLTFPAAMRRRGEVLVSAPLEIERPAPGQRLLIPSPFLTYRAVPPDHRPQGANAYNNDRREWSQTRVAGESWIRYQLPDELLPLKPTRAVVFLHIDAPQREVQVVGLGNDGPVVIDSRTSPLGEYAVSIDRPELLQVDDQGGMRVGVRVGRLDPGPGLSPVWKIIDMRLQVEAVARQALAPGRP